VAIAVLAFTCDLASFTLASGFELACLTFALALACLTLAQRVLAFAGFSLARFAFALTGDLMLVLGAPQALASDLPLTLGFTPIPSRFVASPVCRRRFEVVAGLRASVAYLNRPEGRRNARWHDELEVFGRSHDLTHEQEQRQSGRASQRLSVRPRRRRERRGERPESICIHGCE
jgi:hypothetical protein